MINLTFAYINHFVIKIYQRNGHCANKVELGSKPYFYEF